MEEVSLHQKNTISKMNLEEMLALNSFLVGRIKHERNEESRRMKRQLFVGSKVSFEDDGKVFHGEVQKVMRKFARIRVESRGETWRVPLSLLTKVV